MTLAKRVQELPAYLFAQISKKIDEGGRAGELQENRGRSDTTGQAPFPPASRDENRAPTQKKSDQKL